MKFLLDISSELHKELKIYSAETKQPMNEVISKAIQSYVAKETGEGE